MAAFLMILGGILSVLAKLGEYVVPSIKRQFNYMCCYGKNMEDLQYEVEKLLLTDAGVQLQVDEGRRNLERTAPDVENWLGEVENIKDQRNKLHEDAKNVSEVCVHGGCTDMKSRYQLSKRARKIVKKAIQLQQQGRFGRVSYPVPFGEMQFPANTPIDSDNQFGTRKLVEESIIATLQDSDVKVIGLCGMGGVGKTTLVKRIGKLLKEKKMFDEIVMAVVTQHPDKSKIQTQIAEMLGLKLQGLHESSRSLLLHSRLLVVKRILVILDDIWGWLDLDILGIPLKAHPTCKILLTSRAQDVCVQMGADKILQLQVLSKREAWILFSKEAGFSSDSPNLYPFAEDVANECKGLPLALVSVARALKQKSNLTWENALIQLRCSTPTNILGVLKDVYRPLELSYLALEGDEAKDLFLFCSLFREDSSISIENLVRCGIGLDMFRGINNIREGRIRTHALVEVLKDRFLLLDGHKEGFVKMHDVVRDVAISIASKDQPRFLIYNDSTGVWSRRYAYEHCTHISLFSNLAYIPEDINFPNLVFLLWKSTNGMGEAQSFEKFRTLNVLDLRYTDILVGPSSIQMLTNLRAVHLCGCTFENVSIIGELINLEILCFRSNELEIFPAALGKLTNLRLLDLTDCENLEEIEQGAIGGLAKLEELYVTKNFVARGAELVELESLLNLTTLRILIEDQNVVSENMNLCSDLKEYDISIRGCHEVPCITQYSLRANIPHKYKLSSQRVLDLYLSKETHLGDWIASLLERTDDLRLFGNGSHSILNALGATSFHHLRQLGIERCSTVEHLINGNTPSSGVFPILETLYLNRVSNIKDICTNQLPERSFGELRYLHLQGLNELKHFSSGPRQEFRLSNLRFIYIYGCKKLKSLFSNSVAQSLLQLEELDIGDCLRMDEVFFNENGQDITTYNMVFPKLEKLVLRCLHSLTKFGAGVDRISFPQLRVLKMEDLQQFEGFCTSTTKKRSISGDKDSQILFNKKVHCPRIKTLSLRQMGIESKVFCHQLPSSFVQELEFMEVEACSGLNTIFPPSVAQGLVKLKELRIKNCRMLKKLVENQNEAQQSENTVPLGIFHQLEYLQVDACDRLETLFTPSIARNLRKLKDLRLSNCDKLEEIVEKEDEPVQAITNATPFPQLKFLDLSNLPNLKKFWNTPHDFEIPSLTTVNVDENSPLLESLVTIAKNAQQIPLFLNILKRYQEIPSSWDTADQSPIYISPSESSQVQAILTKERCLAPIGDKPAEITDDQKWNEMNHNIVVNLHLAITDEVLSSISEITKVIWDTLAKLYEVKSLQNKIFLKRKLYTLRMTESSSMTDHINTLNTLFSRLNSNNFLSDNLHFDDVLTAMLGEESRRRNKEDRLATRKQAETLPMTRGRLMERDSSGNHRYGRSKSRSKKKNIYYFKCGRALQERVYEEHREGISRKCVQYFRRW